MRQRSTISASTPQQHAGCVDTSTRYSLPPSPLAPYPPLPPRCGMQGSPGVWLPTCGRRQHARWRLKLPDGVVACTAPTGVSVRVWQFPGLYKNKNRKFNDSVPCSASAPRTLSSAAFISSAPWSIAPLQEAHTLAVRISAVAAPKLPASDRQKGTAARGKPGKNGGCSQIAAPTPQILGYARKHHQPAAQEHIATCELVATTT